MKSVSPSQVAGVAAFIILALSSLSSGWLSLIGGIKLATPDVSIPVLLGNCALSTGMAGGAALFLWLLWAAGGKTGDWIFRAGKRGFRARSLALGIMVASLAVMGLGLAGLLFRPLLVLSSVSMAACLVGRRTGFAPGFKWKPLAPALFLLPLLPDFLVAPLLPPVNVDILVYHLGVPELWRMAHRIYAYPGNMTFSYPMGLERLFLPLQAFGAAGANTWLHVFLMVLASVMVARCLSELSSPHARVFGWLVFGSAAFLGLALQGHQDVGMVFAAALAIRGVVRESTADMAVACALFPFLKYTGLEYTATFALAWLALGTHGRVRLRQRMSTPPRAGGISPFQGGRDLALKGRVRLPVVLVLLCSAIPNLPWLARNWLDTGNPLYPFFSHVFPSLNWRDWNTQAVWYIMGNATVQPDFTGPLGKIGGWLAYFWRAGQSRWFSNHVALFCLLPLLLVVRPLHRAGRVLGLQAVFFAVLFLFPGPKVGRYLLPEALVPLVLCALIMGNIPRMAVRVFAAIFLILNGLALSGESRLRPVMPEEVLVGSVRPSAWWRMAMGSLAGTIEFVNRECTGRGRVLVVGEPSGLGLNRPWLTTDDTNIPAWRLALGDSPDPVRMAIRLRQAGVSWIVYNPLRASRLAGWMEPELAGVEWMKAWARAWKGRTRMLRTAEKWDWTGGVYAYEFVPAGGLPFGPLPWLPGSEKYFVQTISIVEGKAQPADLARQYAVMGEFGVYSYTRMLVAEYMRHDHARARAEFMEAVRRGFRMPPMYEAMAVICGKMGQPGEGLDWQKKAVELTEGEDQRLADLRGRLERECAEAGRK